MQEPMQRLPLTQPASASVIGQLGSNVASFQVNDGPSEQDIKANIPSSDHWAIRCDALLNRSEITVSTKIVFASSPAYL
jgi:hypothetical protein